MNGAPGGPRQSRAVSSQSGAVPPTQIRTSVPQATTSTTIFQQVEVSLTFFVF